MKIADGVTRYDQISPWATAGALACGLVAAVILPDRNLGVNFGILGLAAFAAIINARPKTGDLASWWLGSCALILFFAPAVIDSPWVWALNLPVIGMLSLAAVAGDVGWRGMTSAILAPLWSLPALAKFLLRPFSALQQGWTPRLVAIIRGSIIGALLLVVFGALLSSGDKAFGFLIDALIPSIELGSLPVRASLFLFVAVVVSWLAVTGTRYAGLHWDFRQLAPDPLLPRTLGSHLEWKIALSAVALLFVAFVSVQIAVLFGGNDYVLRTAGLTYAEYARSGFFQLLAASILTLGLVALGARFNDLSDRDGLPVKALLGIICGSTLVILGSAMWRLKLYEDVFGFTRDRLFAHAVILWLGGIFVLILAAGVGRRGDWLPRTLVGFTGAAMIVFWAIQPDALIASRNVERYEQTGKVDMHYLSRLGADAVPALMSLPIDVADCALQAIAYDLSRPDDLLSFNYSRWKARKLLGDYLSEVDPKDARRALSASGEYVMIACPPPG